MKQKLLNVLACPECHGALECRAATFDAADATEILTGDLSCARCAATYPIHNGIPRFVERENYARSFGYQWNTFRREQLDSVNGTRLSEQRFFSETGWQPAWMDGKWLLEAGCGAGRFLEVASRTNADVVGVDLSDAVDAARTTLAGRPKAHLVQASIFKLPFRRGAFGGCYCIGVLQHTPDPLRAATCLLPLVRPGGRIAMTVYERRRFTMLYSKYLIRRLTRHLRPESLLRVIRVLMPVLFPVTELLFRLPVLRRVFQFAIPVANYVDNPALSLRQRYHWAVLDTFDMLAPQFDLPQTQSELEQALRAGGAGNISRLPNRGLNLVAEMPEGAPPFAEQRVGVKELGCVVSRDS